MNKDLFKIEELEPRLELTEWGEEESNIKNGNCSGDNHINVNCNEINISCNPTEEIMKN